jgi:syntaxin 7
MSFQDLEAGRISAAQRKRGGGALAGQTASQAVASGIFQINTSVSTFQRLVNSLGTPKDTPDLRERLYVIVPHLFLNQYFVATSQLGLGN